MSDITDLSALLDALHDALRTAQFDRLAQLEPAIRTACLALPPLRDRGALEDLQAKARRNDRLLAASLRGLRMARHRIAELQALHAGHTTYDHGGRKRHQSLLPPQLTRRF